MPVLGEGTGESESNKCRPLPKSLQALDTFSKLLACTKCGKVPSDKVFNLGSCFHKYCGQCKEELRGKQCVATSCKAGNEKDRPSGGLEDTFSTTLLNALMQLKIELKKGVPKKEDGVEEAIEGDKGEDVGESLDLVELENKASTVPVKDDMPGNENAEKGKDFEGPGKKDEKNGGQVFDDLTPQMTPNLPTRVRKVSGAKGTPAETTSETGHNIKSERSPATLRKQLLEIIFPPSKRRRSASSDASSRASRESSLAREDKDNGDEEDDENVCKSPSTKRLKMEASAISAGSSRTKSPTATTVLQSTSFSPSTPNSGKIEKRNAKGETALHIACRKGEFDKAFQLIEAGGDVNARNYAGWGPLHEAINGKGSPSCKLDLVKLICKDGSCNVNCPGIADETPLHEAARAGLKEILKHLLEHGASPNVRNESGKLPRDVAANEEIASILSEAVASSPEAAIIAF